MLLRQRIPRRACSSWTPSCGRILRYEVTYEAPQGWERAVANVRESSFLRHFVEGSRPRATTNYLIRVLDGRTPIGYVVVFNLSGEAVTCNLDEVAVAEAQRRNGIGSHLVSMAAKLMLSRGFQEMDAVALTGEDGALREQWLARLGFNPYEGLPGHFLHANLELLASGH